MSKRSSMSGGDELMVVLMICVTVVIVAVSITVMVTAK